MARKMPGGDVASLAGRPVELLQRLIRFDTTNPPGNEAECVAFVEALVREAGCDTRIVARDDARPNLVARLSGRGEAPPLLLQGHVDVVTTAGQDWEHDPFGGEIADGFLWGRGALDMKGGVAMMVAAFLRAAEAADAPRGDVILAVMSDEEAGSDKGARFLVEEHPELFEGVRYALGEFGGFDVEIAGRRFYLVQVAEKQVCWLRATLRGPGGHGSLPMRGGAMARLAETLRRLDRGRLPVHVTPVTRRMVETLASEVPTVPTGGLLRALLQPRLTDRVLDLLGDRGARFDPMLHNTVNATIVRGGDKVNVVPSEVVVELDGRILPGQQPEDLLREVRDLLGDDVELEVSRHDPYPMEPDLSGLEVLGEILRGSDASGTAVPFLQPGITDARFFARLGIQTYGFTPMRLPADFEFSKLIHAANERIPVDALEFGTSAIQRALERLR